MARREALPILGNLALNHGLVTREQLKEILAQRAYNPSESFEQALLRIAKVDAAELGALRDQFLKDDERFAALLLSMGLITKDEQTAALEVQAERAGRGVLLRLSSALKRAGVDLVIGGYSLIECLGTGAMGAVFAGRSIRSKRLAAVKIIRPDLVLDDAYLKRFLREAKTMRGIKHPNVVRYRRSGRDRGMVFLALEFVPGQTLRSLLTREGRFSAPQAISFMADVFAGLAAIHELGIIHRDLKPENILLSRKGIPKIADFGLARREAGAESMNLTKTGTILGTPQYMAPEQCEGEGVNLRSDLYALGCVFYHLVCGNPPFASKKLYEVIEAHLTAAPAPPERYGVPRDLSRLILHLLEKKPEDRPESAAAVARALERWEQDGLGGDFGSLTVPEDELGATLLLTDEDEEGDAVSEDSDEGALNESGEAPSIVQVSQSAVEQPAAAAPRLVTTGAGPPERSRLARLPFLALLLVAAMAAVCVFTLRSAFDPPPLEAPDRDLRIDTARAENVHYQSVLRVGRHEAILAEASLLFLLAEADPASLSALKGNLSSLFGAGRPQFESPQLRASAAALQEQLDAILKSEAPAIAALLDAGAHREARARFMRVWLRYNAAEAIREGLVGLRERLEAPGSPAREQATQALRSFRWRYRRALDEQEDPRAAAAIAWDTYARYGGLHGRADEVLYAFSRARERGDLARNGFSLPPYEALPGFADQALAVIDARVGPLEHNRTRLFLGAAGVGALALLWALIRGLIVVFGSARDASKGGLSAKLALLKNDHNTAAEAYERAGQLQLAAEQFLLAGRPARAAELFIALGQDKRAANAFERGGRIDAAVDVYIRLQDFRRAGELRQKTEDWNAAGELFLKAGQLSRAADAFVKAGQLDRAAGILVSEGRRAAAAKLLAEDIEKTQRRKDGPGPGLKKKALRAAELFTEAGYAAEAAAYFALAGELRAAAERYLEANMRREAADAFLACGAKERAIEVLAQLGDVRQATLLTAELAFDQRDFGRAAEAFEKVGDLGRASRAWEAAGELDRAAACARRGQDAGRAADMFARNGDLAKAAKMFEEAGQPTEAARCYEQCEDYPNVARLREDLSEYFEAARAWLAAGDKTAAMSCLRRVHRDDGEHFEALALMASIASPQEGPAVIKELQRRLEGERVDRYSAPAFRGLAELCEKNRRLDDARRWTQRVIEGKQATEIDHQRLRRLSQPRRPGSVSRRGPRSSTTNTRRSPSAPSIPGPRASSQRHRRPGPAHSSRRRATAPDPNRVATSAPKSAVGQDRLKQRIIGQQVDRYLIEDLLGEGAYAWVYRARHVMLNRPAALKVLKPLDDEKGLVRRRFLEEGRLISRLRHPNIVEVYDFGETEEGRLYMALELLVGEDLREVARKHPRGMPTSEAVAIALQVLDSLRAAHDMGVVHRDLKPENIYMVEDGSVRVLDFGIAKVVHDTQNKSALATKDGAFVGTPRYCSPEQARGEPSGPASDIYAIGLILYELLAARLPFSSKTALGYLTLHASEPPTPLDSIRRGLPRRLVDAIHKSLAKQPEERFASAIAFAKAIEPYAAKKKPA